MSRATTQHGVITVRGGGGWSATVDAEMWGPFAVHRAARAVVTRDVPWVVTHTPSGYRVSRGGHRLRRDAREVTRILRALAPDEVWNSPTPDRDMAIGYVEGRPIPLYDAPDIAHVLVTGETRYDAIGRVTYPVEWGRKAYAAITGGEYSE